MDLQILRRISDRPAIVSVVAFVPPPVEHAHVQDAVHRGLLAAGAASFQRRPRIVEPNIDSLREEMRRMHLIIFDEGDMAGHTVVGSERIDLVDKMLAVLVSRMSFSGEDDLHGPPLIQHHRFDAGRFYLLEVTKRRDRFSDGNAEEPAPVDRVLAFNE